MAGACSCESCRGKACGSLKQCLGPVAARVASMGPVAARVALERRAEGFEAGWKTMPEQKAHEKR